MSKQPPPAPTTSAVGPCPTVNQIVGRPGLAASLPSAIAPPDHPLDLTKLNERVKRENFPLPAIDQTLGQLSGAKYFSTLAADSDFCHI